MHELHGHRPFANGRGATLARPGPDVAGGKDAGHARLEQVVRANCIAGEDEPVGSASDGVVEPFRARLCAEEEEEEGKWQLLTALQRDRVELPVSPVEGSDLTPVAYGDAVTVLLVDEVASTVCWKGSPEDQI